MKKINVALVGLGFGGAFLPIYKEHPLVGKIKIFDTNSNLQEHFLKEIGAGGCYNSFREILDDPETDAVHLVTPIPVHEEQTVQVLEAGKHCACTVPMAISLEGIRRITETVRKTRPYKDMVRHFFTLRPGGKKSRSLIYLCVRPGTQR
ncbi:MAG: Gfo/Idh/MocA family oxidoreductase [Clostridiales bacterium]|nr:Gfo/Idh/MocA family oxidoreductase [Clostridiales bacterium]